MKRKVKNKRKEAESSQLKMVFFLVIITVFLLLLAAFVFNKLTAQKPCANSISCTYNLSGKFETAAKAEFMGQSLNTPAYQSSTKKPTQTLGEKTDNNKHIYIDLSNQHLYAFEGDKVVYNFPVSTGKWYSTPTGDFKIWIKLRYTRMTGGNPAIGTYYNLPNVPYTMYFYNDEIPQTRGFGIHGAYWHNNFGHPMSHGCVNMRPEDAGVIYNWANPASEQSTTYATAKSPGTPITIYGVTPEE